MVPAARSQPEVGVVYQVAVDGVDDDKLRDRLRRTSRATLLQDRPPPTVALLHSRAERDLPRLLAVLRSQGYYGGTAELEVRSEGRPVRVVFTVDPGPRYLLQEIVMAWAPGSAQEAPAAPPETTLKSGDPAIAETILAEERRLVDQLQTEGYPFAAGTDRQVVVDHATRGVHVTYILDPGPLARFGGITITGLNRVHEKVVLRDVPWRAGQQFNRKWVGTLEDDLLGTGLFSTLQVRWAEDLAVDGSLAMRVEAQERRHRSIGLGAEYESDTGVGGSLSWTHRNLLRGAEQLRLSASVTEIDLRAEGSFRKPHFLHRHQSLVLGGTVEEEEPDAFLSRSVSGYVGLSRRWGSLSTEAGVGYTYSEVEQLEDSDRFGLFSLPLHADWDHTDNALDPRRGGRLLLTLEPTQDVLGSDLTYLRTVVEARTYLTLPRLSGVVLAGRGVLGQLMGADRDKVPADERFYAGGGGSIRGYDYQSVGEIEDGTPLGGDALVEMSLELRLYPHRLVGLVAFLDGGTAFRDSPADSNDSMRWGAGPGLRVFTPVGPLRFDVAFPLDRRSDVDNSFEVYISLGQAF